MKKKGFSLIEIFIVVLLILTTIILCIPAITSNTKEAKIISGWKRVYSETESNFEIFSMNDYHSVEEICKKNESLRDEEIFKIIAPYLNVDMNRLEDNSLKYGYKFYNGSRISFNSLYYTNRFAITDDGKIIGFKWINCKCDESTPCASVIFDMNGKEKPNRLGKDIFGIFVFKNRVEAFGYNLTNKQLEEQCNSFGANGSACSEFYLRGGKF